MNFTVKIKDLKGVAIPVTLAVTLMDRPFSNTV